MRAMDTVVEFSAEVGGLQIAKFGIGGASKVSR